MGETATKGRAWVRDLTESGNRRGRQEKRTAKGGEGGVRDRSEGRRSPLLGIGSWAEGGVLCKPLFSQPRSGIGEADDSYLD